MELQLCVILTKDCFQDFVDQCDVILPWMTKDRMVFKSIEKHPN